MTRRALSVSDWLPSLSLYILVPTWFQTDRFVQVMIANPSANRVSFLHWPSGMLHLVVISHGTHACCSVPRGPILLEVNHEHLEWNQFQGSHWGLLRNHHLCWFSWPAPWAPPHYRWIMFKHPTLYVVHIVHLKNSARLCKLYLAIIGPHVLSCRSGSSCSSKTQHTCIYWILDHTIVFAWCLFWLTMTFCDVDIFLNIQSPQHGPDRNFAVDIVIRFRTSDPDHGIKCASQWCDEIFATKAWGTLPQGCNTVLWQKSSYLYKDCANVDGTWFPAIGSLHFCAEV